MSAKKVVKTTNKNSILSNEIPIKYTKDNKTKARHNSYSLHI